ncbi:MAG: diaminopimelate decarboxylase [Deltaproteobacteria bacterium]|nr:diaminopimelate decarboxylase [Deltaproteobacteria bacterium]
MPMTVDFKKRLYPGLPDIARHFGTPFHIYDETGIRKTASTVKEAFAGFAGFKEFFAVKALPNPAILSIFFDEGFGFDCSSVPELILVRKTGAIKEDILFTSNNTSADEFKEAFGHGGSLINIDDISLIQKLPGIPDPVSFRYNPGPLRTGNAIIGNPVEAKYGVSHDQIVDAYKKMLDLGSRRFGLHTMLASNELDHSYLIETARMLLDLAGRLSEKLSIRFEFINIGGGMGIPYHPGDKALDLSAMVDGIRAAFLKFYDKQGYEPNLFMESGRYMTGPHGVLVTRVINRKETYRNYVGVDASMSALMRPGIYGAYHHIDIYGKSVSDVPAETVDVVGALCENIDKFAIQRNLPKVQINDLLIIHDTGAHGHAMGFNYNGRLRPKELMLKKDGTVELIRREETVEDYFATLNFEKDVFKP